MRKLMLALLVIAMSFSAFSQSQMQKFFSHSDIFLKKYVQNGKVDYNGVRANNKMINILTTEMQEMHIGTTPNARAKAFLINAYNILVIYEIAKHPSISTVNAIPGFFDKKRHKVAGAYYTFDDLKAKILKDYKDPQLLFSLIDGAKGCPSLMSGAMKPENVNAKIKTNCENFINNTAHLNYNAASNDLTLSGFIEWNKKYIKGGDVLAWVNAKRADDAKIPDTVTISYTELDWKLNK